jgi:hypothetical protein
MHLRSAVDIVLALLFSPQPSSLAALVERKFWPSGCWVLLQTSLLTEFRYD